MFFYYDTSIIILIPAMIFAMAAQGMVKRNFSRYGKVRNGRNMTCLLYTSGRVAMAMTEING